MTARPDTDKPVKPWKRFLFGFFAPVLWLGLSFLLFPGDLFLWACPGGLALAALPGLVAALYEKRWAFFLGLISSFSLFMATILVSQWLKS